MKLIAAFGSGRNQLPLHRHIKLLELYRNKNRAFAMHDYHEVFLGALNCFKAHISKPLLECNILEIGCGQRFGATLLFHSLGAAITGVDYNFVTTDRSWAGTMALMKRTSPTRAAKLVVRRLLFDRQYYTILEREFGRPLQYRNVNVRTMDARALAIDDSSIDYIFSNAVFEHIDNVEAATREMARVLVPGGVARIGIHLFPSLSGGHHPEWMFPDERTSLRVPPWDHLRRGQYSVDADLNELREADFLRVFREHLTIVRTTSAYEGRDVLTPSITRELAEFSEDDLLKRSTTVVLRKNRA